MVILTKLENKDFVDILANYSIGQYKSSRHLDWALANTVYELKTDEGKFILKIFEKSSQEFIDYQIKIIDYLDKNKVPVAKILKSKNGTEFLVYKGKPILIQNFVEGKTQEKYSGELLTDISRNFALMNKTLLSLKIKDKSKWKKDYQFKSYKSEKIMIKGFELNHHAAKLSSELKTINKNKLRRGVTHGDFHGINLLIRNNKLKAVIDFDDSHVDYIAYEVAVFMIDPFITEKSFNKSSARMFFREYQKYVKLNEEEKKAIYYFVKHRLLGIIIWVIGKMKIHKDYKGRLTKTLDKIISKYNSFNRISLEDFIGLF